MYEIISFFRENALWILLFLATVASFLWILKFKEKLRLTWYAALILAVVHTVLGVLSVKAFAFLESYGSAERGGMSLYGAVFAMPILYFIGAKLFKRRYSDVYDVFTLATVVALFSARVNCIISGCCLGIELSNGFRVPTRGIELVFYFILLNVLMVKVPTEKLFGRAYPLFMFSYGAFRFIIEFFREANGTIFGIFHIAHLWSLISFIIGLSFFIALTKKHGENKKIKSRK